MLNGVSPKANALNELAPLAAKADSTFANLEVPLTHSGLKTSRKTAEELKRHDQWILKADPAHIETLKSSGIGAVTLANNHAMDYGGAGIREMTSLLDSAHIIHAGAADTALGSMAPSIVTLKGGKRVALLSVLGFVTPKALRKASPATLSAPGIGVLSFGGTIGPQARKKLADWIGSAKRAADFVVVGIHWGIERKPLPTPYQVELGRAMIDAGADVVWGNHPHVLQGAELYRGHAILYSCGNLISNLPAQTGVFRLKLMEDGSQQLGFFPAVDQAHGLHFLTGARRATAVKHQRELNRLLLKRYPSPVSVPAF